MRRIWALPLALVAGIVVQRLWPGDFEYGLKHGGPGDRDVVRALRRPAALLLALVLALRRPPLREQHGLGTLAVVAVLAAGLHPRRLALEPRAADLRQVRALAAARPQPADEVPKGAIVIAPLNTSYRVAARRPGLHRRAPVGTHVANTKANDPYGRARTVHHWVPTNDPRSPAVRGNLGDPQRPPLSSPAVKVLLVTMYFPPPAAAACSAR